MNRCEDVAMLRICLVALGFLLPSALVAAPSVAELRDQLRHGDVRAALEAAQALGDLGPAAVDAVPELTRALGNRALARPAALALGRMGREGVAALLAAARRSAARRNPNLLNIVEGLARAGPAATADLARALEDESAGVRFAAVLALERLGPLAIQTAPDLGRMLLRRQLTLSLRFEGATSPPPLERPLRRPVIELDDDLHQERIAAARALQAIGPAATPVLIEALREQPQRWHGPSFVSVARSFPLFVSALLKQKDEKQSFLAPILFAVVAAPGLLPELAENDPTMRRCAAEALWLMDPVAPSAVADPLKATDDSDEAVSDFACYALGRIGSAARAAVPAVIRRCKARSVRSWPVLLFVLEQLGADADAQVERELAPLLIEELKHELPTEMLRDVARACSALGRRGRAAAPLVRELLDRQPSDEDAEILCAILCAVLPDPLPDMRARLRHRSLAVRLGALHAMRSLGPRAASASPELRHLVRTEPVRALRDEAMSLLDVIAVDAADAVPVLIDVLDDSLLQTEAANQLGEWGRAARSARPTLRKQLQSRHATASTAAALALLRLGEPARQPLARLGALVNHPDEGVRRKAHEALRALGPRSRSQLPSVGRLMQSREVWDRLQAAWTLATIAPERAYEVLPFLLEQVAREDKEAVDALGVLYHLGPIVADAAPALTELLEGSRDSEFQFYLVETLGRMGAGAAPAVPILRSLLLDADDGLRAAAARALGHIGPAAAAAIPRLHDLLDEHESNCRIWAAFALHRLAGDSCVRVAFLTRMIVEDKDGELALRMLGAESRLALPALVEELRSANDERRTRAAYILDELGLLAAEAAPPLTRLLDDARPAVRTAAARALSGLGQAAHPAWPRLRRLLRDGNAEVAAAAGEALVRTRAGRASQSAPPYWCASPGKHTQRALAD
jgi:HEAT repeat protein